MRLIDADALKAEFLGNFGEEVWHYTGVRAVIDVAPTIDAESMTYKWHDLRKDPNDLPEDYYSVLICLKGFEGMRAGVGIALHNRKNGLWGTSTFTYKDEDVIAWREIEPFEVDE